jgi:RNA polymerase sigma factor (sigma-70 family)
MNRESKQSDLSMDLERITARLTPRQRLAVKLRAQGYNQAEIAKLFGISQQAISKLFAKLHRDSKKFDKPIFEDPDTPGIESTRDNR